MDISIQRANFAVDAAANSAVGGRGIPAAGRSDDHIRPLICGGFTIPTGALRGWKWLPCRRGEPDASAAQWRSQPHGVAEARGSRVLAEQGAGNGRCPGLGSSIGSGRAAGVPRARGADLFEQAGGAVCRSRSHLRPMNGPRRCCECGRAAHRCIGSRAETVSPWSARDWSSAKRGSATVFLTNHGQRQNIWADMSRDDPTRRCRKDVGWAALTAVGGRGAVDPGQPCSIRLAFGEAVRSSALDVGAAGLAALEQCRERAEPEAGHCKSTQGNLSAIGWSGVPGDRRHRSSPGRCRRPVTWAERPPAPKPVTVVSG